MDVDDPMGEGKLTNIDETQTFGEIHVSEFKDNRQIRIAAHSHVVGLGLEPNGEANDMKGGLVGQKSAREACGIIVDLIKQKKMSGRAVLLAGPPGSGKTAIAMAIAQELGDKVPFYPIVASEVYSSEVKKTEMLMEGIRKAISLQIKDTITYYEGEVTEITPIEDTNAGNAYGKTYKHITLTLRSVSNWKKLQIDGELYDSLLKQHVEVGDVIFLDNTNGIVKRKGKSDAYRSAHDIEQDTYVPLPTGTRKGKSDAYRSAHDIEQDTYVPLPTGTVDKTMEEVKYVTLHSLDQANAEPRGSREGGLSGFLQRALKPKKTEITERLRSEVNKIVNQYIENGRAVLYPGVLFIDEVHMLDMECFTFLHRALESSHSPVVVFATNRGLSKMRGSDEVVPFGLPPDIIDRLLIIPTRSYPKADIKRIVAIRAKAEGVELDAEALNKLAEIGFSSSLRYTIQLLTPCKLLAGVSEGGTITANVIEEVQDLFMDARTSASKLTAKEAEKTVATASQA
uniref:RuvB-like helicase n=1 Tax=Panagrolaimus sp. ES5 TaxID=591445 RepID=A0AC34FPD4_9BILA